MWAQYPEKLAADARRRQLVATQAKMVIVEDLEKVKPAEN